MGHTLKTLESALSQVQTQMPAMREARVRRDGVLAVAGSYEGVLETYISGSLATGLMIRPVTDGDCGIVLDRRVYPELGPDGADVGPMEKVEEVLALIERGLRPTYPAVKAKPMKRGLLVEFNEPLDEEQDPTVDLVIALNRRDDDALWIPQIDWTGRAATWSPGHPKKHVQMLTSGSKELRRDRARAIRLAKAWKNQEDQAGICSFNLAALALECLSVPMPLDDAMLRLFEHGARSLAIDETDDPAHVSGPIHVEVPGRQVVATRLRSAADGIRTALANDDDADVVADALSGVFPDYVKPPIGSSQKASIADALRNNNPVGFGVGTALATGAAVTVGAKSTRAYGSGAPAR
jgi:hypothetical protein